MTIFFSKSELEYIVQEKGNWHASDKCPEKLRKKLEAKLRLIYQKEMR